MIAFHVSLDSLKCSTKFFPFFLTVPCEDQVEIHLHLLDQFKLCQHVGDSTLSPATWLVNHHPTVWKDAALSFCASAKKKSSHTAGLSQTDRSDIRRDVVHRIIDAHACGDGSARTHDVHGNVLLGIALSQEEKLRADDSSKCISDWFAKPDDTVLHDIRENVVATFTVCPGLKYVWDPSTLRLSTLPGVHTRIFENHNRFTNANLNARNLCVSDVSVNHRGGGENIDSNIERGLSVLGRLLTSEMVAGESSHGFERLIPNLE